MQWRLGPAARILGISRPTLNDMIDRHATLVRVRNLEAEQIQAAIHEFGADAAWESLMVSRRSLKLRMGELNLAS
ncbi:MAG: hypothetical protein ACI9OJ_003526 [Myxococcota bacterium]